MLGTPIRCYNIVKQRHGVMVIGNGKIGHIVNGLGRNYAKDKSECCKDIAQSAGKKVEDWPKPDPPPTPWRYECPPGPQPVNYDPYRIKVPDVVVPPLPPSNAKRIGVVLWTERRGDEHDYNQGYGQEQGEDPEQSGKDDTSSEGFLGYLKRLFGGGKSKEDRDQFIADYRNFEELPNEDSKELFRNPEIPYARGAYASLNDLFHSSPMVHPDCWKNKSQKRLHEYVRESLPKLGYHGKNKYKYAFHEPWKPLDRMVLLDLAEKEEELSAEKTDKQLT